MKAYAVTATRSSIVDRNSLGFPYLIGGMPFVGTAVSQVPTFYLLANVQGIVSAEHAERIARDVLGDAETVTAVEVTL